MACSTNLTVLDLATLTTFGEVYELDSLLSRLHGNTNWLKTRKEDISVLIIKLTRWTNFSIFGIKLYMFQTVPLSIIRSFSLYTQQWYMYIRVLITKPTRCTKFPIFGIKLYMFQTVPLSIIRSFSLYTQHWYMSYRFADSLWAGSGWIHPEPAHKLWHIPLLSVQQKTPDDGQRNCPKHVEFYSINKFEKLVHLIGFIVRLYHDARSPERQGHKWLCKIYQYAILTQNKSTKITYIYPCKNSQRTHTTGTR